MLRVDDEQAQSIDRQDQDNQVFTEQELALAKITKDFTIGLNKKEVRDLINTNPLFDTATVAGSSSRINPKCPFLAEGIKLRLTKTT